MKNILSESTQFHLQCKYFNKFYSLFDYFGGLLACILSLSFILVRTHSELSSPQPDPLCCTRCPLATEKKKHFDAWEDKRRIENVYSYSFNHPVSSRSFLEEFCLDLTEKEPHSQFDLWRPRWVDRCQLDKHKKHRLNMAPNTNNGIWGRVE